MTYQEFLDLDPKPEGKASADWSSFPLWFGSHEELLEEAAQFTVIDDFMGDEGMDDFAADFEEHFPSYRMLAVCDVGFAQKIRKDFTFDSYAEFFLVVDTASPKHAVLLWTGESRFEAMVPSFAEFWDSLRDWPVK
jgi:hypothetical protein